MDSKQLLLMAWNGPFSLGPLTKPVKFGDLLVKIMEISWKAAFVALSVFIIYLVVCIPLLIFGVFK